MIIQVLHCPYCQGRSYWIPGSYVPTLSENHNSFLRLLKNKDFKEGSITKVALDAVGTSTTLESNKSLPRINTIDISCVTRQVRTSQHY
jgi:hypothetical protein